MKTRSGRAPVAVFVVLVMLVAMLLGALACGALGGLIESRRVQPAVDATVPGLSTEQRAYLGGLRRIDVRLAADEWRAVQRGDQTCTDLNNPNLTPTQLLDRVAARSWGAGVQVDRLTAGAILLMTSHHLCPAPSPVQ